LSSYAARKRQRRGCPPLQTSARAKAERLSLLLHGDCRHPSMRKRSRSRVRGAASTLVSGVSRAAVRRKLIGNAGRWAGQTGSARIVRADGSGDSSYQSQPIETTVSKVSAVAISTAALTLCPHHYQASKLLSGNDVRQRNRLLLRSTSLRRSTGLLNP
jgi:hypothetical protein